MLFVILIKLNQNTSPRIYPTSSQRQGGHLYRQTLVFPKMICTVPLVFILLCLKSLTFLLQYSTIYLKLLYTICKFIICKLFGVIILGYFDSPWKILWLVNIAGYCRGSQRVSILDKAPPVSPAYPPTYPPAITPLLQAEHLI